MTDQWLECKLGDVITLQRGFDLPQQSRREGAVPIVTSSGITGYHDMAKVAAPGVVTGRYGTLGEVYYVKEDFWPHNTALFVRDFKGNDPLFVSYFLRTLSFATQNAAGAVPGVNRNALHLLSVKVPPLPTQRKIAAILSAYDDLIEVNTRRIALLEEMARGLYREWFVRFRYPGHEGVRMVESAVGLAPEGWEVVRLGDACVIVMGQSPSSEFYNESKQGLPFHQGVTDFGHLFPRDRVYCTVVNRLANDGDILFSVRAPVGRINIANKKIVIGRGLSAIRSKADHQVFVYFQLKHIFQEEDIMGGGTIFKAVTKDDVHGIKLLWPPESLIVDFEQVADPILSSLGNLTAKNANLRRTRDLLLPRLVAGEVGVGGKDMTTNLPD